MLADRGVKNKGSGLPLFAQWACRGPCGEQKGKALSGATIGSAVANSSLSQKNKKHSTMFLCLNASFNATKISHQTHNLSIFFISLH